jgi:hypothetical protein
MPWRDPDDGEQVVAWGTAPTEQCPANRRASCQIVEYMLAAEGGGRRQTIQAGDTISLDHGLEIVALVSNARDLDGDEVDVFFPGRRDDGAANDLGVGVLVRFGDFRYLIAGDLTGDPDEDVADVEGLIADDARDVDVYHVNHHGSRTSSSIGFMREVLPTVAVVSNGRSHGHPRRDVINDRILSLDPRPTVYLTNLNNGSGAWREDLSVIADPNFVDYDGTIQVTVWRRSYRVFLWRDGDPIAPGTRFMIKQRN